MDYVCGVSANALLLLLFFGRPIVNTLTHKQTQVPYRWRHAFDVRAHFFVVALARGKHYVQYTVKVKCTIICAKYETKKDNTKERERENILFSWENSVSPYLVLRV